MQLWTLCVRTKRGLVDTGRAGGYCKDQVSFAGLMQLLQNRERVSFELLHSCKLPWQCVASTPNLQRARDFGHPPQANTVARRRGMRGGCLTRCTGDGVAVGRVPCAP